MQIQSVRVGKKIILGFASGDRKQNLGAAGASAIILAATNGKKPEDLNVSVDMNLPDAMKLAMDLAEELGREFIKSDFGGILKVATPATTEEALNKPTSTPGQTTAVRTAVPHIILDKGLVYSDSQEALNSLKADLVEGKKLPVGYKCEYTKTFARGKINGQIKSLFRDYKKYGDNVAPKIYAFVLHNMITPVVDLPEDGRANMFLSLKAGTLPHHPEAMTENGKINMWQWKLFVLIKVAISYEMGCRDTIDLQSSFKSI